MTQRLYIDLNHWIGLAKSRKVGDLALETRIAALVDAGRVVVPVSAIHIMEVAAILKDHQRSDLATTLRNLSRGVVLRALEEVQYLEMASRIGKHYRLSVPNDIRPHVVATGYYRAFGEPAIDFTTWRDIDPAKSVLAEKEVRDQLEDQNLLDKILSLYSPKIPKDGPEAEVLRATLNQTRVSTEDIDLQKAEADCVMGLAKDVVKVSLQVVEKLGISQQVLAANPPSHFWTKEYLASIPTVNVWAKLHLYLARAMAREMTVNDLYDMGHMAVALPYCEVVVADSAMAHLLTFRRLHETYGTKVYSSLIECIDDLEK